MNLQRPKPLFCRSVSVLENVEIICVCGSFTVLMLRVCHTYILCVFDICHELAK